MRRHPSWCLPLTSKAAKYLGRPEVLARGSQNLVNLSPLAAKQTVGAQRLDSLVRVAEHIAQDLLVVLGGQRSRPRPHQRNQLLDQICQWGSAGAWLPPPIPSCPSNCQSFSSKQKRGAKGLPGQRADTQLRSASRGGDQVTARWLQLPRDGDRHGRLILSSIGTRDPR